jgi:hypothetical protein
MTPAPLPALNLALLLRALLKRGRKQGAPACSPPGPTVYALACLNQRQLQRYKQMLGFEPDAFPLTFWYLVAQRAHLGSMLSPAFPFRIAGMIHVANTLSEQRCADPLRPLIIRTTSSISPPSPSGAVNVTLDTAGEQDGGVVFTCSSTYLAVRGRRAQGSTRRQDAPISQPQLAQWQLEAASGRRYAAVSGDWNPIHLSGWSARLMGLRSPIIHGMHTVAKACAALERQAQRRPVALSARFQAPVPLRRSVTLFADLAAGTYAVGCDGRLAVEGSFTLAVAGSEASARP